MNKMKGIRSIIDLFFYILFSRLNSRILGQHFTYIIMPRLQILILCHSSGTYFIAFAVKIGHKMIAFDSRKQPLVNLSNAGSLGLYIYVDYNIDYLLTHLFSFGMLILFHLSQ